MADRRKDALGKFASGEVDPRLTSIFQTLSSDSDLSDHWGRAVTAARAYPLPEGRRVAEYAPPVHAAYLQLAALARERIPDLNALSVRGTTEYDPLALWFMALTVADSDRPDLTEQIVNQLPATIRPFAKNPIIILPNSDVRGYELATAKQRKQLETALPPAGARGPASDPHYFPVTFPQEYRDAYLRAATRAAEEKGKRPTKLAVANELLIDQGTLMKYIRNSEETWPPRL